MILAVLAALQASGTSPAPQVELQSTHAAEIRRADGSLAARAMVFVARGPLQVRIQAAGLAPGQYGAHFHAVGRCEGPDFVSAGPHWNPTGRQHGSLNPRGQHLGDMPNFEIDAEGHGRLEHAIGGGTLTGDEHSLLDADGGAVVIHAAPDDYRTDPAGNSGARIACGVLSLRAD